MIVFFLNSSFGQSQNRQERKKPATFAALIKEMDTNEGGKFPLKILTMMLLFQKKNWKKECLKAQNQEGGNIANLKIKRIRMYSI